MAVFQRIGDLIRANINDLLDRAEDPEKMIKQLILDMEKELANGTEVLGKAMASQKQMQKNLEKSRNESAGWENKAKLALKAGDQDLAKQALAKKVNADNQAAEYQKLYDQATAQVTTVKAQVDALKLKLDEAKTRQATLIARSQMADAQKSMSKAIGNIDSTSAYSKFNKMEEKITAKEAEAEAYAEITGAGDLVNDPFKDLESASAVDAELARLMAEMNEDAE
ncbi:MAG: PspA/IM30 family protein [Ruminococcus sp.]|nr:PspA/IM30 family protein [Ruminococcus sp.]